MDSKYLFFNIIMDSFVFFAKNFRVLFKTMFPSVFLQLLGSVLAIAPGYYITQVLGLRDDALLPYIPYILLSLTVGTIVVCAGVYKYIMLMPCYCLACDDYDKNLGFNYEIYKNKLAKRKAQYIKTLLWTALPGVIIFTSHFLLNIVCLLSITAIAMTVIQILILVYILIYVIYSVKISLVSQVFVFEPDKSPREAFGASLKYMRGKNAFFAFGLLVALCIISSLGFKALAYLAAIICGLLNAPVYAVGPIDFILGIATLLLLPLYMYAFTMMYKRITKV